MCQFLNIEDFGKDDCYILNKDLKKDSVTIKEFNIIFCSLTKEHRDKPGTPQLTIFFFASHGIDKSSQQHIVLNEYDKNAGFYTLLAAEAKVRVLSEDLLNGYFIALFACCRELYRISIHSGCIYAKSYELAKNEFDKREKEEQIQRS